jgi:two-component system sensor kinase FixL
LNLLLNACDSMSRGPEAERVVEVRTEATKGAVRLSVTDRGEGLTPEAMKSLFKPFYTTKPQGLGLGLSVCNSIVAAHGGELRASNNPRRGATFTFSLHTADEAAAVARE